MIEKEKTAGTDAVDSPTWLLTFIFVILVVAVIIGYFNIMFFFLMLFIIISVLLIVHMARTMKIKFEERKAKSIKV